MSLFRCDSPSAFPCFGCLWKVEALTHSLRFMESIWVNWGRDRTIGNGDSEWKETKITFPAWKCVLSYPFAPCIEKKSVGDNIFTFAPQSGHLAHMLLFLTYLGHFWDFILNFNTWIWDDKWALISDILDFRILELGHKIRIILSFCRWRNWNPEKFSVWLKNHAGLEPQRESLSVLFELVLEFYILDLFYYLLILEFLTT